MKINANFIIIYVALLFLLQNISAINPPSYKKCQLNDSCCLVEQAQKFIQGIQEFGNISFNPLRIDYMEGNPNKLHYIIWNTNVTGFNTTIIDDIWIKMDIQLIRILFHLNLIADFDYKCDGEFYGSPIFGGGKGRTIMDNFQVELVCPYKIVKNKQGQDIIDLESLFYGANAIGGVKKILENLYNGDKVLGALANAIINKTWRTWVASYANLVVDKYIEKIFQAIKNFLRSIPLKDLVQY